MQRNQYADKDDTPLSLAPGIKKAGALRCHDDDDVDDDVFELELESSGYHSIFRPP